MPLGGSGKPSRYCVPQELTGEISSWRLCSWCFWGGLLFECLVIHYFFHLLAQFKAMSPNLQSRTDCAFESCSRWKDHLMTCEGVSLGTLYGVSWCGCNRKSHYLLGWERECEKRCPNVAFATISWSSQSSCWNGPQISDSRLASSNELLTSYAFCSRHNIVLVIKGKVTSQLLQLIAIEGFSSYRGSESFSV